MSTKIYSGIKINVKDIHGLMQWKQRVQKLLEPLVRQKAVDIAAARTIKAFDLSGVLHYKQNLSEVLEFSRKKFPDTDHNKIDLDLSIAVFPYQGEFYAMYFTKKWSTFVRSLDEVEDFCYFNNTDKPDELTNAEWDHRRDTWDAIMEISSVPSDIGFILEMFHDVWLFDGLLNVNPNMPTKEERAIDLALSWFVYPTDNFKISEYMRAEREYRDSAKFKENCLKAYTKIKPLVFEDGDFVYKK